MRHVLSALVMNQPGVLAHISGMLASRAFNIDSLAVGATENPRFSRVTFVVNGNDRVLDQVSKQNGSRSQIKEISEIFRARIVDVSPQHVMVEISGRENKIEAFIEQMRPFGILEMVRTGRIAMLRADAFTFDGPTGDRPPVEAQESAENPESA